MFHIRTKSSLRLNNLIKSWNLSAKISEKKLSVVQRHALVGIHKQFKVTKTLLKKNPVLYLTLSNAIKTIYQVTETKLNLQLVESLTQRIKTIIIVREIFALASMLETCPKVSYLLRSQI